MQISLATYSVRIRESHARKSLDFADAKVAGLFDFFKDYFKGLVALSVLDTGAKKMLGAKNVSVTKTDIEGIIVTGEYGYETEIVDTKKKKQSYRRSTTEAELLPFFFRLYLPAKGNCGVLILQRFGVSGIRTVVARDINLSFQKSYPDLTLNINPQVPDGVLQAALESGELKKIILRKSYLPNDISDALNVSKASAGKVDMVITAKIGLSFRAVLAKVRAGINSATPIALNEIIEVDGFKQDKILLGIDIGGKDQTIDLSNLNKIRAHVDITQKVKYALDGHPVLSSISEQASDLMDSVRAALNIVP